MHLEIRMLANPAWDGRVFGSGEKTTTKAKGNMGMITQPTRKVSSGVPTTEQKTRSFSNRLLGQATKALSILLTVLPLVLKWVGKG